MSKEMMDIQETDGDTSKVFSMPHFSACTVLSKKGVLSVGRSCFMCKDYDF
jgi:hypothetical protein